MREIVGEPVQVEALFQQGRIKPGYFAWQRRLYKVKGITGHWSVADGFFRNHHFTVLTGEPNLYELAFSTQSLRWELVCIYHESCEF